MADPHEEVHEELKGAHKMFSEKTKELSAEAPDGTADTSSWTKGHARALHKDLDASLHKLKMKLSRSDHPAHEELEGKVDQARVDMKAEFATIEDGDHAKAHNIVTSFHMIIDGWMEDISSSGREW